MRVVAQLTRLSNVVVNDDVRMPWTVARLMDTDYVTWDGGTSDGLVIVQEGWYWCHVNITTLGTFYGGADNSDFFVLISRNGIALADTLIGANSGTEDGAGAGLMHTGSPVYLEAGDELFVFFQNNDASSLLIESNPSDGVPSGYLADDGPGTIGPHFFLMRISGNAPS